jgi:hypothetical protein
MQPAKSTGFDIVQVSKVSNSEFGSCLGTGGGAFFPAFAIQRLVLKVRRRHHHRYRSRTEMPLGHRYIADVHEVLGCHAD